MKTYYYDIDNARFVDTDGEPINRFVPELFYQERAEWKIALRNGENTPADLSRITVWGAAVADDFRTDTTPMCRTQNAEIAADAGSGEVTVPLDCATEEFLACVSGVSAKPARFELYGLDSGGRRIVNIGFDIRARMTLDPDPGIDVHTPDTVATKAFVSAYVRQSGALMSGAEIDTQIGPYRITATSGGVSVSGSGASVVLSGGQIVASAVEDPDGPNDNARLILSAGAVTIRGARDGLGSSCELALSSDGVFVNARPVATQLVTSTYSAGYEVIPVLSGGTYCVCTADMSGVYVDSVVKTTEASYLHFTLGSVTAPTPVVISGFAFDSGRFEGGKEYLVGFFDGMAVVNEVTSGGVLQ